MTYLVDTTVIARLNQSAVKRRVTAIGTYNCRVPALVLLEMGVGARNHEEHRRWLDTLTSMFTVVTMSPWAQEHAIKIQRQLAIEGTHRSAKLPDLLIAATALQHDATVLHYDRDFDLVSRATGVPCEWVAPPGTLDGQQSKP